MIKSNYTKDPLSQMGILVVVANVNVDSVPP